MCLSSKIDERKNNFSSCIVNSPREGGERTLSLDQNPAIVSKQEFFLFEKPQNTLGNSSPPQEDDPHDPPSLPTSWLLQDPFGNELAEAAERPVVHHDYHDYSEAQSEFAGPVFSKGGVAVPFPTRLYEMLAAVENDPDPTLSRIVTWQPHGRCFIVTDQKEFTKKVLPEFFQQKKYASFQRQLNLYGFKRLTQGPDRGSYYHELFLRGKKFLTRNINRIKIKGNGSRMASNPEEEPHFYAMDSLPTSSDFRKTLPVAVVSSCVALIPSNKPGADHEEVSSGATSSSEEAPNTSTPGTNILPHSNAVDDSFMYEEGACSHVSSDDDLPDSKRLTSFHASAEDTTFLKEMEEVANIIELEEKKDFGNNINSICPLDVNDFSQEEMDFLLDFLFE
jgi:hypothetical protein